MTAGSTRIYTAEHVAAMNRITRMWDEIRDRAAHWQAVAPMAEVHPERAHQHPDAGTLLGILADLCSPFTFSGYAIVQSESALDKLPTVESVYSGGCPNRDGYLDCWCGRWSAL